jgi:acyl-CoA thioester hydrolase
MHENFFHELKVYYEDTDSGGVVYYANYLKFLERARTEALFSIGYSNNKIQQDFNSLIIVKSCNIEYKKPAYLENELIVEAQIHLVFINKDGKPKKIPEQIYSKFKPYFCDSIKK